MFSRRSRKPLRLELAGRKLTFETLADFEFSLSARTEVPASKVSELVKLSASALHREAVRLRDMEKRFVALLAKSLEDPQSDANRVRELGSKVFSQDHEWRDIFAALLERNGHYADYLKMALVKYLQYLGSRQDVLKSLYADRLDHGEAAAAEATIVADPSFRETVIFDVPSENNARMDTSQFERLPKGETVAVRFGTSRDMEVILSKNRFKVIPGRSFSFNDENGGSTYPMQAGRNVIGRDTGNEVVIEPRYRDVSRTHLVIEPFGEDKALFTDLSAHGTYVPIRNLHAGAGATQS